MEYTSAKYGYELLDTKRAVRGGWRPSDEDKFMSEEEFMAYPDETSKTFREAFEKLLEPTQPVEVTLTRDISEAISNVSSRVGSEWKQEPYNRWIAACFGPMIFSHCSTSFISCCLPRQKWKYLLL